MKNIYLKNQKKISDKQSEHLKNIRSKAAEKKIKMTEDTLKAKLASNMWNINLNFLMLQHRIIFLFSNIFGGIIVYHIK